MNAKLPLRLRGVVQVGQEPGAQGSHRLLEGLLGVGLACLGNPDPVGMKVYAPSGEETFDDVQTTEEAQAGADRRQAA